MAKIVKILAVLVMVLGLVSCSDFQKMQKTQDLEEKYEAAIKYYESGDYYRAGLLFEELIPLMIGTEQAEVSQFYYSYCHYHQGQLYLADYYFGNFIKTFPRSERAEEAWFMKCKSLYQQTPASNLEQSATRDALNAIQMFANRYPKSTYLPEVNKMVDKLNAKLEKKDYDNARLYSKLRYYKSAVIALDNFIKNYPGSKRLEEIYFLKIESQFNLAEMSIYDKQRERYNDAIKFYQSYVDKFPNGKKLNQAEQLYDQILNSLEKVKAREELRSYELTRDQLNKRKYTKAKKLAENFMVDYPGSKYLEEVTIMRIEALYYTAMQETEIDARKDGLEETMQHYESYKSKFPESKSTKRATTIYTKASEQLSKLKNSDV